VVLCPSAARFQWRDELLRWLPELAYDAGVRVHVPLSASAATAADHDDDAADALDDAGASAPPSLAPSALVHVLSYDLAVRCSAALSLLAPRVIVCDESQYLKSRTAQRTRVVLPLLAQASRALLLSGTPALSSPSELYTQLHVLAPQVFGSWTGFAHRFCDAKRTRYGLDVSGASNLAELHTVMFATVALRRTKNQVLAHLPPKRREVLLLPCNAGEGDVRRLEKLLNAGEGVDGARHGAHAAGGGGAGGGGGGGDGGGRGGGTTGGGGGGGGGTGETRALLLSAYQDTGISKLPALIQYVRTLVASRASHPKVLLFGHHLAVLDGVEEGALACVAHIRIDGATPPAARHAAVLRFQQSAECRVALIAISAGGTALTLTAASHVVFLELYWTPAALLQAEDRVHRIGQTAARVQVTYLLGAGTLDEALWAALKRKSRVLGETLEGRAEACATTGVAGALSSSSSAAAADSASATSTGLASGLLLAAGAVRRLDALGHVCDGATSRFFTAPATAPPLPARAAALRKIGANAGVPINLVEAEEAAAAEEEGEVVAEQHRLVERLLLGEMDGLAHVMTAATSTEGAVDASEDVDHDDAIDGAE